MGRKLCGVAMMACALAAGCRNATGQGSTSGTGGAGSGSGTGGDSGMLTVLAPSPTGAGSCDVHASVAPQFTDVTDAWGLGDGGLWMVGNRILSADLDNDGYPDLIVNAIGTPERETIPSFWDGGFHNLPDGGFQRLVSVLMNRPNPAGGRMFVDTTQESLLFQTADTSPTQYRNSESAAVADVNNDGNLDVFTGAYHDGNNPKTDPGDHSEILLGDGQGHFTMAAPTDPTILEKDDWSTSAETFTDVDLDGHLDLFEGFWYQEYGHTYQGSQAQLYLGDGTGAFHSVVVDAGLKTNDTGSESSLVDGTNSRPAYGVTACDLNGDGAPELLVSAYGRQWNLLYQNDGTGHFTEVGQDSGFAGDNNRDYSDNQFFECYCTLHASQPDCVGVARPAVQCPTPADSSWDPVNGPLAWQLNGNGFTTVCRDMDGDGRADLYNANITHWWAGQSADPAQLLTNTSSDGGLITFDRIPNPQSGLVIPHLDPNGWNEGLVMAAAADLDGDGRPDLIAAGTDYPYQFGWIFHQLPDAGFSEVGEQWGLHFPCMSGLTVADFDRDGDLDVIVGAGTARDCSLVEPGGAGWKTNQVHIFQNNSSSSPSRSPSWLEVRLRGDGVATNTYAIGARVTVTANGVAQVQEMGGGYGTFGMGNDIGVLFFGLGSCGAVDSIEVRWPNKSRSTDLFSDVPSNHLIELHEGDPNVYAVNLK